MTDKPPPSADEIFAAIGRMTAEAARSPQASPAEPDVLPLERAADEDVLELTDPIEPMGRPVPPPLDVLRSLEPLDGGAVAEYRAAVERVGAVIGASYAEAEASARGPRPAAAAAPPAVEGRTVEGLVAELLRPLLREWLDANLPHIVERAVAAEVARASRERADG
jgi:uncharacterized protein